MADTYDLIVVGAGMAGAAASNKCGSAGWRVAIVDELPYGGTCALQVCDPKKILRRGAEIVDSARLMAGKGIDRDGLSINWADLIKHNRCFTDPVPKNMEAELARNGSSHCMAPPPSRPKTSSSSTVAAISRDSS